jgi:hypothetical protein
MSLKDEPLRKANCASLVIASASSSNTSFMEGLALHNYKDN